ncbi:peptide ABC transporter permease [Amylibacter kogurei]|uniref:Peptide ABC transporter permease n=1 Tax=Paramylibacter kogurei TaxID=1889778 RepID=A0A2G5K9K8_9RHOB|nr:DMT family transporter [Amylibacter kogurei]PIB25839.1 peptide ABC transporter permease [Amylibacter kogurei]
MSISVFLAVIFAAFLHAAWNGAVKFGADKLQGMVLLSIAHGLIGLAMIWQFSPPAKAAWGLLAISVLFHLIYKFCLTAAYERGDLSRVYPIARGLAPMIVLVIGFFILPDDIQPIQFVGVLLVGCGILLLARGVFTMGESRALLPFALGSAIGTAGYSLSDGMGARLSGDVSGYVGWLFFFDAIIFTVWGIWRRGLGVIPSNPKTLGLGLAAGAMSVGAYWIAVWAMTVAPIALVTGLRETSVMFAILIGFLVMGEKIDKGKMIAALVIMLGVIVTRI